MSESAKTRFGNIARLFAVLSMNKGSNFADTADKIIGKLSTEELMDLFYGNVEEITVVIRKHQLPFNFMDLVGILIDGEPTSAKILALNVLNVPPKGKLH